MHSSVLQLANCMCTHLLEPDVLRLLSEALTADVEAVLADETSLVSADAAVAYQLRSFHNLLDPVSPILIAASA